MRTTMLLCALTIGTQMAAARSIQMEQSAIPDCCRSLQAHELNAGVSEERNRVKYGRYSAAKEARVKIEVAKLAIHGQKCLVWDRCPLPADATSTVAAVTGTVHFEPCEHACCQAGA